MSRLPMPIGTWGRIKRVEVEPGRWYADCRIRDADGITRRVRRYSPLGVTDRKGAAAERELVAHLMDRTRPAGDSISTETTVAELWTLYRAHLVQQGRAPRTLQRYEEVAVFIDSGLRGIRLREATTQRLDAFLTAVEKANGRSNAKSSRSVLSGMFTMAVRLGALTANPVRDTTPVGGKKGAAKSLEPAVLIALLDDVHNSDRPCPAPGIDSRYKVPTVSNYCASADLVAVIVMFVATGVRMSELLGIQWSGVDFKAKTVRVDGKVVRIPGEGLRRVSGIDDPKNTHRTLPLPDFALTMLRARKLAAKPNPAGLVFPSTAGTVRDPDALNKQWRRVRTALELPEWVTGHTFRRTVASILDEEKMPARATADQLGHASPSMTMDKYMSRGKVRPEVAMILDRVVGGGGESGE